MKNYIRVEDLASPQDFVRQAMTWKGENNKHIPKAAGRALGMVFFNPSLRTRLSSLRAAQLLGLDTFDQNVASGWPLEFDPTAVMDQGTSEHIEEAAVVLSQYCDLLAIRAFPKLDSRDEDYREPIMSSFTQFAQVPIVNLESATRHPLQGLADMLTIEEHKPKNRPKIVLTWAPHPKALPHSVANSFVSWCKAMNHDITIVNPPGGDLSEAICAGVNVVHNQEEAFAGADFIYAKNWSSYTDYGQRILPEEDWTVTAQKMALTNQAKFMHCLPVRRNVVVSADVLQSDQSLVIKQANNRTHAAYAIFRALLDG